MRTDPIADMLSMIANANQRGHEKIVVDHSHIKERVGNVLVEEGYLKATKVTEEQIKGTPRKFMHLYLKYGPEGERVIRGIKRVSKPGRRVYTSVERIPKVLDDLGISVLSTSSGVMSHRLARRKRIGGELLCQVW